MADPDIAAFGQSVELAAVAAYQTLAPRLSPERAPIGALFIQHHQDHASTFGAIAGELAVGAPNGALVAALGPKLFDVTGEATALEFAYGLESQLTETHAWALTMIQSADVARTTAAVLAVQSAHVGVLGVLLGKAPDGLYPTGALVAAVVGDGTDVATGFDPAKFPVG